jgi:hypothetical protein
LRSELITAARHGNLNHAGWIKSSLARDEKRRMERKNFRIGRKK